MRRSLLLCAVVVLCLAVLLVSLPVAEGKGSRSRGRQSHVGYTTRGHSSSRSKGKSGSHGRHSRSKRGGGGGTKSGYSPKRGSGYPPNPPPITTPVTDTSCVLKERLLEPREKA